MSAIAVDALTTRELEMLRLVAAGYSSKQIASRVGRVPRSVENHITRIVRRFGLRNRCHLVTFAFRQGWIV